MVNQDSLCVFTTEAIALFRRKLQVQTDYIAAASDGGKFKASGQGYIAFGRENPALLKLMFGPAIEDWSRYPELVEASQVNYDGLQTAVAEALPDGFPIPASAVAAAAWSMVHGLTLLMVDGQITAEKAGVPDDDTLIEMVLQMLGGPPAAKV